MKALLKQAIELDQQDELADFSKRFVTGDYGIYLDGNSLGKLPIATMERVESALKHQWGNQLINSWNDHWLALPKQIAINLETFLGAHHGSVYIGESTSINLYKLILGLQLSEAYQKNLSSDELNFPSDNYILQGIATQQGSTYHLIAYKDKVAADIDQLKKHIADNPGIICLSMVSFKSAYYYPVKELNEWAQQHQSIIVWDMSHAVGICEVDCKSMKILAAVGCTYKYLNGGPGSPAFLMLDPRLLAHVKNPIQGWFGHQNPFDFESEYVQSSMIDRFANGTPSILSMSALDQGLALSLEAGIVRIAQKNKMQMQFLIQAVKAHLLDLGYELYAPESIERMGGHLSISHPYAREIVAVLKSGSLEYPTILPDFRPPNLIRLGIASLYVSYVDLATCVGFLKSIVVTKSYENVSLKNHIVP